MKPANACAWIVIAGLAVVPILRVRFPLFDTTVGVKGLVGLLEILFVLAVFSRHRFEKAAWNVLSVAALGLAAWGYAVAVLSDQSAAALVRQTEWVAHALFACAVFTFVHARPERARPLVLAFTAGLILYFVEFSIFRWTLPWPVEEHAWSTDIPGFSNVRHLGYWAMACVPLGLFTAMHGAGTRVDRLLADAALTVAWCFLFWTGGRGPWFALAAGAVPLLLAPGRVPPFRVPARLVLTAAGGFALSVIHAVPGLGIGRILERTVQADSVSGLSSGRVRIWSHVADVIRESPMTGAGPDGFLFRPPAGIEWLVQPHSSLLQAPLEWGVPGAVLFIAVAVMTVYWVLRAMRNHAGPLPHRALTWALCALLALSMIDGTLYHAQSSMLVALCIGIALAAGSRTATGTWARAVPIIAGCVCALVFAIHIASVSQATGRSAEPPRYPSLLVAFPSGMADYRSTKAMRARLIACLESTPGICGRLASIAGMHARPPWNSYFRTVSSLVGSGDREAAHIYLTDIDPVTTP